MNFFEVLKDKKLGQQDELFLLNDHKKLQFQELFSSGDDRYAILKEQQSRCIHSLCAAPDMGVEGYTCFCEIIVGYWCLLKSQKPQVFRNSDMTALVTLGESLWFLIKHEQSDKDLLWCYALLLQEVLAEKDQHLTVPSDLNHHVLNSGYFKSTLLLHVIAEKISSSFDSCQRMDWLNAALTLNQSASNRLPQALSCSLLKDYRDDKANTSGI